MISLYGTTDAPTDLYEEKPGISAFRFIVASFQFTIFVILLIFFFGAGTYVIMGYNTYMDYVNNCYIKIDKDVLKGNRETVFKALTEIKNDSSDNYSDLCAYVDTISEAYCLVGESRTSKLHALSTDGCYIKGTKTIFIKPESSDTDTAVNFRKTHILKYSQKSKEYWSAN